MPVRSITIGVYLFNEVEVLDFAGPFEVFNTAARLHQRLEPDLPPIFEVFTLSDVRQMVIARGGLKVQPDYAITNHPAIDVLLIPGGIVTAELERPEIITWIKEISRKATITASVCTGAFLLAQAGLLDQKPATTHWEDLAGFQSMFPEVDAQLNSRWVDNGQVVTSAGISAGIGMSLHLVERLESRALAVRTARQMEFDWEPDQIYV